MAPTSCSLPVAHQNFTTWVIIILPSKVEKCIGWKSCPGATRDSTSSQVSCELVIFSRVRFTVYSFCLLFFLFVFAVAFTFLGLFVFSFLFFAFFCLLVPNARQIADISLPCIKS